MTTRVPRRRTRPGAAPAALLCVALLGATACGASATGEDVTSLTPPPPTEGRPAGTVTLPARTDVATTVKNVQDAITASGGTVVATVDNAADARTAGAATIPGNTVVIGGAPAVGLPMLRANQQAAATLPERYLVREDATGAVTLVYNGPDYVAAVSGVVDATASTPFAKATTAVADQAVGEPGAHQSAPLIGVTPRGFLRVVAGNATVPATVERLQGAVTLANDTLVAQQDLAVGSAAGGPALRATTSLLISAPAKTAPLVAANPTFGLELPLRFVVWLDEKNATQIGYVDIGVLAARHGLAPTDPAVVALAAECDRLAKITAGA